MAEKLEGKCPGCGEWIELWNGDIDCHLNDDMDNLCPGSSEPPLETRLVSDE